MRVSASTVIYRTDPDELLQCLACLVDNGVRDIWIVDNSPQATGIDTTILPRIKSRGADIRYRHLPHNPGYGAAHNVAIREACALGFEAHLVVNTDIQFEPGTVGTLMDRLIANGDIGQISPRIVSPDGTDQYAQRLLPTPLDVFGRRFLPSFLMRRRNRRYMLTGRDPHADANIPYHQGSFMLFRMSALEEVDGFDERFFMYPEDIDITRRIRHKHITLYCPQATVVHAHRASSYRNLRMLWVHCRNMITYFNKWGWWIDRDRRALNRQTLREMHLDHRGKRTKNGQSTSFS